MHIHSVEIEDTFAEAFPMTAARVLITAETLDWARVGAELASGYATSVIACDAEAGVEREWDGAETPDGRPGVSVLVFAFSRERLEKALVGRVGQCVLTCATTACYNGLVGEVGKRVRVGGQLRYFGDGFQISKRLEEATHSASGVFSLAEVEAAQTGSWKRRLWRIPVMDGEFTCEDYFGTTKGVAGGNFLVLGQTQESALRAAEAAVAAIRRVPDCIMPFPGGIVRSGSKVGSRYKGLRASTNEAYCPTLRGYGHTALPEGVNCVYEVVIDGLSQAAVEQAMRAGMVAACRPGVVRLSAGNYGGSLGPYHLHLHRLLEGAVASESP